MPGCWVEKRDGAGGRRWRVRWRLGGAEARKRFGGSFATRAEALARKRWIDGELAAMRVPDVRLVEPGAVAPVTVRETAERWLSSRVDVAAATKATYRVNLERVLPTLGGRPVHELTHTDVTGLVASLQARGLVRQSIRKTLSTLRQVLAYAELQPNPVDHPTVRLPPDEAAEVEPPDAATVTGAFDALAPAYRVPMLTLDQTGMRVGELERLTWGDVDEREGRWRVSKASAKTRRGRWVPVPEIVLQAVAATVPREDRNLDAQVFAGFDAARFRTALTRACKAAGVAAFSPHDLRHRRATLWHLQGMPVAEAAGLLGHAPGEHLRTYAHVVLNRAEIDCYSLLERAARVRRVPPSVPPSRTKDP